MAKGDLYKLPSQEYLLDRLSYDEETGRIFWRRSVYNNMPVPGSVAGYRGVEGYWLVKIDGILYRASRIIVKMKLGIDAEEVDHRDRNSSNNRWDNLRPATRSNNAHNSRRRIGRSGVRGVQVLPDGRFLAKIKVQGKQIYIGYYRTVTEAETAYKQASEKYYGEFAYHGRP